MRSFAGFAGFIVVFFCLAVRLPAGWDYEFLSEGAPYRPSSFALDAEGQLHRAYLNYPTSTLIYARLDKDSGEWRTEAVAEFGFEQVQPFLFLGDGEPMIIYWRPLDHSLHLAWKSDSHWRSIRVAGEVAGLSKPVQVSRDHGWTFYQVAGGEDEQRVWRLTVSLDFSKVEFQFLPLEGRKLEKRYQVHAAREDEDGAALLLQAPGQGSEIALGEVRLDKVLIRQHLSSTDPSNALIVDRKFMLLNVVQDPMGLSLQLLREEAGYMEAITFPPEAAQAENSRYLWLRVKGTWLEDSKLMWIDEGNGMANHPPEAGQAPAQWYHHRLGTVDFTTGAMSIQPVEARLGSKRIGNLLGRLEGQEYFLDAGDRGYWFRRLNEAGTATELIHKQEPESPLMVDAAMALDKDGRAHFAFSDSRNIYHKAPGSDLFQIIYSGSENRVELNDFKIIDGVLWVAAVEIRSNFPAPPSEWSSVITLLTRPIRGVEWATVTETVEALGSYKKADLRLVKLPQRGVQLIGYWAGDGGPYYASSRILLLPTDFAQIEQLAFAPVFPSEPNPYSSRPLVNREDLPDVAVLPKSGGADVLFSSPDGLVLLREDEDGQWREQLLLATENRVYGIDGVIDESRGVMHVTFDSNGLHYLRWEDGEEVEVTSFSAQAPHRTEFLGNHQAIALEPDGSPVILYSDPRPWAGPDSYHSNILRLLRQRDNEWTSSTVLPGDKGFELELLATEDGYRGLFYDWEEGAFGAFSGKPELVQERFPETVAYSNQSWYKNYWFGLFWGSLFPYVWHQDHGWLYMQDAEDGYVFWSFLLMRWLYVREGAYPNIYSFKDEGWLYFMQDSGLYWDYASGSYLETAAW